MFDTSIASFQNQRAENRKEKGMDTIMTMLKLGKGAVDVASGNWLGVAGDVLGMAANSKESALSKFNSWLNGRSGLGARQSMPDKGGFGTFSGSEKRG